ncbi:flavin monoamine oxidase family protein [Nocardiopsis sp. NPDC055824]
MPSVCVRCLRLARVLWGGSAGVGSVVSGEEDSDVEYLDVAVVGAGLAGCHVANRLAEARRGSRIGLFENDHRIGGRMHSVRLPGPSGAWADLGAMRLHTGLRRVLGLVEDLGLGADLVPFEFGRPENLFHLRGSRTRQGDLAGAALPYRLRPAERGLAPGALADRVAQTLVPGFTESRRTHHEARARGDRSVADRALADFRSRCRTGRLHNRPLEEATWSDALRAVLSGDAVAFVHDAGGYDVSAGGEGATAQLDLLYRTPPDAEYVCLRRGMESLPRALHERFTQAGGVTRLGHRLVRVERGGAPGEGSGRRHHRLLFRRSDTRGRLLPGHVRVCADAVVLALPPGPLGALDLTGLPVGAHLSADLAAVEAVPALKLFHLYRRPWWRDLGLSRGRSTTDAPLRQLWYGSTCQPPGGDPHPSPAPMLAAYPSGPSVGQWLSGRIGEGPAGDHAFPSAGDAPAPGAAVVARAHALLRHVHGLPSLEPPLAACWRDWSSGAWHTRRPGHDPRALARRMGQPAARERVHVVGDCWTHDPGSVEGTLDSAEAVLREHFALPLPEWYRDSGAR